MKKYDKLIKALRCKYDGEDADGLGCSNKRCEYRDVDSACDLAKMCDDAAAAIEDLMEKIAALQKKIAKKDEEIGCMRHNVAVLQETLEQQAKNCDALIAKKDSEIARVIVELEGSNNEIL